MTTIVCRHPSIGAAPIVKWCGGKRELMPEITKRMPTKFGRYFEPFLGGGAVLFEIMNKASWYGCTGAVAADANTALIEMYDGICSVPPAALVARLRYHERAHSEAHYYEQRELWNARRVNNGRDLSSLTSTQYLAYRAQRGYWPPAERTARFLYLNRTCFNGLWRVNSRGEFNVPMGRYENPKICDPAALKLVRQVLRHVQLYTGDYRSILAQPVPGDFVYFDSPYDPHSKTSNFTGYTAAKFGREEQVVLAHEARKLVERGVQVMLSNNDTKFIREIYAGDTFRIDRVKCRRAINASGKKRGKVNEVIITGGYDRAKRGA